MREKNVFSKDLEEVIKMLKKKCLINKLCLRDAFQILNLFCISTEGINEEDMRNILSKYDIRVLEQTQFKHKKEHFNVGDKLIIYSREGSKSYGSKRRAKVLFINDDYITVRFKNYSTSILYVTMENLEFLISKEI